MVILKNGFFSSTIRVKRGTSVAPLRNDHTKGSGNCDRSGFDKTCSLPGNQQPIVLISLN